MPQLFTSPVDNIKHLPKKLLSALQLSFCTVAILGISIVSAFASSLPAPLFDRLALACAPGVELTTLRAVAAVESHFNPLAVRDNTTQKVYAPRSPAAAATLAEGRVEKGHSVDIGLMQINSRNLTSLGMRVGDALDPCRSLDAAQRMLLKGFAAGSSESERQAAILITLSRYNSGRPLAGIASGYVDRVIAAQSEFQPAELVQRSAPDRPSQWNIWGISGAEPSSWVVTTDKSSEIERAGAQSTDARNEGRAAVPPSAKGEPYELFAYQESEPIKP